MGLGDVWNNWFGKKEKEIAPNSFYEVVVTPVAKSKGILDEHNKTIRIWKNGVLKEEMPYTPQLLDSIKKIDELPGYEETFDQEEEFEFYPFEDLGATKTRGRK